MWRVSTWPHPRLGLASAHSPPPWGCHVTQQPPCGPKPACAGTPRHGGAGARCRPASISEPAPEAPGPLPCCAPHASPLSVAQQLDREPVWVPWPGCGHPRGALLLQTGGPRAHASNLVLDSGWLFAPSRPWSHELWTLQGLGAGPGPPHQILRPPLALGGDQGSASRVRGEGVEQVLSWPGLRGLLHTGIPRPPRQRWEGPA